MTDLTVLNHMVSEINQRDYEPDEWDKVLQERIPGLYCEGARHLSLLNPEACLRNSKPIQQTNWISLARSLCSESGVHLVVDRDNKIVLSVKSFVDNDRTSMFIDLYRFAL